MNARLIGIAVIAAIVAVGCGKKDGSSDAEKAAAASGEQAADSNHVEDILALAKKSAKEDNNVNFYGFFPGMSRFDAQDLAAYYKLKEGECTTTAWPGKAVSVLWFSLKGVRRLTGGGSTMDELAQAVANRVGDLKGKNGHWEHDTIDGVRVWLDNDGLLIWNDSAESQEPIVTKRNVQRESNAQNEIIKDIIGNMVAIPGKSFKMGKYEVTQTQWQVVMGENPSRFKGAAKPVESVSWNDCKKFIEKLNAMPEVKASGLRFRLPTDKEWSYACLAGLTKGFCRLADGSEITRDTYGKVAWFGENSGRGTHAVGRKEPNAFGLYDMYGNVREWCEDEDFFMGSSDSCRVHRGGCWSRNDTDGNRFLSRPDSSDSWKGFRLAAD